MGTVVDLLDFRQARGRGVRPGTASIAATVEPPAPGACWERQAGADLDEPEVLRAEEYEYRGRVVRMTTLSDGDVVLAVETDNGATIHQLAVYLDDEGLDWLGDELAHASAVRAAIIGTAS